MGQRKKMKMAVIKMQKQGSEEKQEEKAHNKVEGGQIQPRRRGRNHSITKQRWDQPPNKVTTRSTSPETIQTSWMYTRMLVGKEK